MQADQRRYALAAAAATAFIALAIVTAVIRDQPPVATGSPSTTPPTVAVPRILFAHHVVLDTVPGGGPVVTSAYDSFEVLTPGGPRQSHAVAGVAVGTPVFDGRDRVAFWRRASITRSPLELSGAYEVVVWDMQADRERLLLVLSDERSNGELLWSADAKSLVVPTRTTSATSSQSRLLLIDADSGATRVLHVSSGDALVPLFADAQLVVGVRGSSYVVVDATSGAVRTQMPLRAPAAREFASAPDGTVLELVLRFESEAGPLRMWSSRDPATDLITVDERGITTPTFWPGRTEVVFAGPRGVMAADYRSGQTRRLVSPPDVHRVLAVEAGGRFALFLTESGNQLFERAGDELKARPDLQVTVGPTLRPLGLLLP